MGCHAVLQLPYKITKFWGFLGFGQLLAIYSKPGFFVNRQGLIQISYKFGCKMKVHSNWKDHLVDSS